MGILSGNPQDEPMHYGEVFGVWSYLSASKGLLVTYQTFINHTGDKDLKGFLEDLTRAMQQEIQQVENLLKANGVAPPPTPAERPVASLESIPAGARFNDPEIAAGVGHDLAAGLVACSQIIGQCIREDIAMMYSQFHSAKVQFGQRLLRISKEKGWLVPPPLHLQTPELVHA
ncbi:MULTISPECIES: DUF3231 family protein [Brevibacillus]|jgi:hypothetical protein|uniref:DUF3231 family protein n=2 Tax=Brevibacillus TaxID=55080 RepID=M8EBL8_9BACL|nr:hypothetical protein I532_08922 [Brevibacillus borstelensis AK1]MBE5397136.1 DUF3231 family protein [Brevibacillus borstelensis]RNB63597.1 DUF3231 family protein [Brevibacillus borstelensis]GED50923.1 membrane protein [Brevibacillus borstelensis]